MEKKIMNNILVDSINLFDLDTNSYSFDKDNNLLFEVNDTNKKLYLEILEDIQVNIVIVGKKNNLDFNIKLNKNSSLNLNIFSIDGNVCIDANLLYGSNLTLNNSILNSIDSTNHIRINHLEDRSVSNIKNHGFSKNKAKLIFDIEGSIIKEANKCICNQDNQIIENENSFSTILPKLLIDNYDVEASHAAYVGEFKENELFYLQSRGISLEDSKFLLLNAFLLGCLNVDDDYKSKLKEEIIKYFGKEV